MKKLLTLSLATSAILSANSAVYAQTEADKKALQTIYITSPSKFEEPNKNIAAAVTVLTEEDIELSGQTTLPELLRATTGVGVSNQGGAGKVTALRIRGEEAYRTHVYIDGVRVADPSGVQVAPRLEHIQLKGIERIEVLRGVQGFAYGADAGGIVNIVTRRGLGELEVNLTQARGSFNESSTAIDISQGNKQGDFYLGVNNSRADGFNALKTDSTADKDGYENSTFHSKLGVNADDNLRFQLVVNRVLADNEYDNCFGSDDCLEKYIQTTQKITGDYDDGSWAHQVGIANTDISRSYFTDGSLTFLPEGQLKKLEYNGFYKSDGYKVIFGADSEKQSSKSNFSPAATLYSNVGQFVEYKDNHIKNLSLSMGVRTDKSSNYGSHVSSRVSLAYVIPLGSQEFKLRATSGNGFRAPSLNEVTNSGSQSLKEEQTKGYELGFDWLFNNGGLVQVTHFDQTVNEEITYNPALGVFGAYEQVDGKSTSQGVEISTKLPVDYHWAVEANYTYNDTNDNEGNQRLRRPEHSGNLSFRYIGEKLKTALNLRAVGSAIDTGNVRLDNYVVANLGGSYQLDKKISFFGTIHNLLDKDYEEVTNYNTAERSFNIGTQISF